MTSSNATIRAYPAFYTGADTLNQGTDATYLGSNWWALDGVAWAPYNFYEIEGGADSLITNISGLVAIGNTLPDSSVATNSLLDGVITLSKISEPLLRGDSGDSVYTIVIDSLLVNGNVQLGDSQGDTVSVIGQLRSYNMTNDYPGSILDTPRQVTIGPNLLVYGDSLFMGTSKDLLLRRGAMDSSSVFQFPTNEGTTGKYLKTDGVGNTSWDSPGGGDNVSVNGSSASDADLDDATPAAPAGGVNVIWQKDAGTPNNVSGYVSMGDAMVDAFRVKPWYFDDILGAGSAPVMWPWTRGAVASGTTEVIYGEENHPGILKITSSATVNSGAVVSLQGSYALLPGGGETFETEFMIRRLTECSMVLGFIDAWSGGTLENQTDGAYIYIADGDSLRARCANSGGYTGAATAYLVSINTWYRARVQFNADKSAVDVYLWNAAGSLLWSETISSGLPDGTDFMSTGIAAVYENTGQTYKILDLDYLAFWYSGRALTR